MMQRVRNGGIMEFWNDGEEMLCFFPDSMIVCLSGLSLDPNWAS